MPTQSVHRLKRRMLTDRVSIVIVGCGGTGSAVLSGLPYLHHSLLAAGHPKGLQVYAIDGDRVSETNCVRQPFTSSEIGLYKAHVLMQRLNVFWGARLGGYSVPCPVWTGCARCRFCDQLCGYPGSSEDIGPHRPTENTAVPLLAGFGQ